MKKILFFTACCSMAAILLSTCVPQKVAGTTESSCVKTLSHSKKADTSSHNFRTTSFTTQDAANLARERLTEDEKSTITNLADPVVKQVKFTQEPNIYKYKNTDIIAGKKLYQVTFHTEQDSLLGPIVFYLDAYGGQIYGMDFQE